MIGKDIHYAASLLKEGNLVSIPTETVYGLAANALNTKAVSEIFRVKKRPSFDPLILHTNSLSKVEHIVVNMPEKAKILAKEIWPGPLTLVLPKAENIDDIVTSGLSTVAVRIPNHPLTLELLSLLEFPLAAPSANPFGYVSPTKATHVESHLGNDISYILDGGNCQIGLESTIVGFENEEPVVLRKGGTRIELIEEIIGKVAVKTHSSSSPKAPGMLKKHYSPGIPLVIGDITQLLEDNKHNKFGVLSFQKTFEYQEGLHHITLSEKGDFSEAARNLFSALRKFDELQPEIIYAELLPEKDLGVAINDRIRRAAAK